MRKRNIKNSWKNDMLEMYFFKGVGLKEEKEYSFKDLRFFDLDRGVDFSFYIESKDDFIEGANYIIEANENVSEKKITEQNVYLNEHGHYQVDIHEKDNKTKAFTFIWDITRMDKKNNAFEIDWEEFGWNSFEDVKNYDVYFPKKFEKLGVVIGANNSKPHIELIQNLNFIDSYIINNKEKLHFTFETNNQLIATNLVYIEGKNPFKTESWDLEISKFVHVLEKDEVCEICGQKSEDSYECKYFNFSVRKHGILNVFLNDRIPVINYKINRFMIDNNIEDIWRKNHEEETLQKLYYSLESSQIKIKCILNNEPYILKDIQWKKNNMSDYKSFYKIENWDYENATLVHMDSYDIFDCLSEYKIDDCHCECGEILNYNEEIVEEVICETLNKNIKFKREIVNKALKDTIRDTVHLIQEQWQEFLKPKKKIDDGSGYVYFIKELMTNSVKIGMASSWKKRLDFFTVKLPFEIKLLHKVKTSNRSETEKNFHEIFEKKRRRSKKTYLGEWFDLTEEDIEDIKSGKYDKYIL